MFFPACEHIANNDDDLREQIRIIDEKLSFFLPTATIQPSLVADATDLDEDVVNEILQSLEEQRLLVANAMIRCPKCKTLMSEELYSEALDNEEPLECTGCEKVISSPEDNQIVVYRFSDNARKQMESSFSPIQSDPDEASEKMQVVLLIHGIRTHAEWQPMVRRVLQRKGRTTVYPIKYGRLDAFCFWSPVFTRRKKIDELRYKIKNAIAQHPGAELIIIAHSFGTYAVITILREDPHIQPHRAIFCGSIVSRKIRWDRLRNAPELINDCGSKDIYPALAASTTWGYGATGTFGFGFPPIRDRHHKMAHSDFFSRDFVEQFWRPWVHDGEYIESDFETEQPPASFWTSILPYLPLKYLLVAIILGLVGCLSYLLVN